jgi:hypothetical protein
MLALILNEHTVRRYRSRKVCTFLLFCVFAFLSLASSTASLSAKLGGHPQVRAQVSAPAQAMLRDISQSAAQGEETDYSSLGSDTDEPLCAALLATLFPAANRFISLARKDPAPSSPHPLRSTPLAPRAPPFLSS